MLCRVSRVYGFFFLRVLPFWEVVEGVEGVVFLFSGFEEGKGCSAVVGLGLGFFV